jgi:RNA 2',3'-cyclic 3'-phosphodiesterase
LACVSDYQDAPHRALSDYPDVMRLFVGIGLPAQLAEALAESARALVSPVNNNRMRWTPPANMHVTLSFLGQVHTARLEVIEQALAAIRGERISLELDGFGIFDRVGVLYANVKKSPPLLALAEQVVAAMEGIGFAREKRPYSPHITLTRSRDLLRLISPPNVNPAFHESFDATELRLYQSLTLPGGAQYQVMRAFSLG